MRIRYVVLQTFGRSRQQRIAKSSVRLDSMTLLKQGFHSFMHGASPLLASSHMHHLAMEVRAAALHNLHCQGLRHLVFQGFHLKPGGGDSRLMQNPLMCYPFSVLPSSCGQALPSPQTTPSLPPSFSLFHGPAPNMVCQLYSQRV